MDKDTILQMVKELRRAQGQVEYLMESIQSALEQAQADLSREDIKELSDALLDEYALRVR